MVECEAAGRVWGRGSQGRELMTLGQSLGSLTAPQLSPWGVSSSGPPTRQGPVSLQDVLCCSQHSAASNCRSRAPAWGPFHSQAARRRCESAQTLEARSRPGLPAGSTTCLGQGAAKSTVTGRQGVEQPLFCRQKQANFLKEEVPALAGGARFITP